MDLTPVSLRIDQGKLIIEWSDQSEQAISIRQLRERCPCAACRDEKQSAMEAPKQALPIIDASSAKPLGIDSMEPVGHYAYTIRFTDGHSNGIFTFEQLKSFDRNAAQHD